jgi:anti-sigma factor RsiW
MAPADNIDLSNERLVAYIDGEVSASEREAMDRALQNDTKARERLNILSLGNRPFSEAFDLLLDAAPDDRLQAMLADIVGRGASPSSQSRPVLDSADKTVIPMRPRREAHSGFALWQMAAAAAILALVFAGGLFAGGLFEAPQQVAEKVGWREAAARYVSLFSKETLEGMPADPQQRQANLKQIETSLGLSLSGERIASASLSFEGSQLLQIEGKPLAQIAYLRDGRTPVALCITRTAMPTVGPATEQRYGLNVVHWVANGYGFMVIGKVPESDLAKIAADFRGRFS